MKSKYYKYAKSVGLVFEESNYRHGLLEWQYVGAEILQEFPEATHEEIEDVLDELVDYYGMEVGFS